MMPTTLSEKELKRMSDEFFHKRACDRCGGNLRIRTMSWFTEETICGECGRKEQDLRKQLRAQGDNRNYEGCGYIPKLKKQKVSDGSGK